MANDWCGHCEMRLAYCPHGNPDAAKAVEEERHFLTTKDLVADGPTITATQNGRCVGCQGKIEVGDQITHVEDGWAHAAEVEPVDQAHLFEGI